MIYTPQTKSALKLCFDACKDKTDKANLPYVFHPFHLAEQVDAKDEVTEAERARARKCVQALELLDEAASDRSG